MDVLSETRPVFIFSCWRAKSAALSGPQIVRALKYGIICDFANR